MPRLFLIYYIPFKLICGAAKSILSNWMGAFVTRYQIIGHITAQQYVESWWLKVRQVIKYFAVIKGMVSAIEYMKRFISNLRLLGYGQLEYGLFVNKYIYISKRVC